MKGRNRVWRKFAGSPHPAVLPKIRRSDNQNKRILCSRVTFIRVEKNIDTWCYYCHFPYFFYRVTLGFSDFSFCPNHIWSQTLVSPLIRLAMTSPRSWTLLIYTRTLRTLRRSSENSTVQYIHQDANWRVKSEREQKLLDCPPQAVDITVLNRKWSYDQIGECHDYANCFVEDSPCSNG